MNYWSINNGNAIWPVLLGALPFIWLFAIIDVFLRGFALWRSARRGQNIWFVALLIVNTLGILPLIYILLNRETKAVPASKKKKK